MIETREITQVKIYKLVLNDMRCPHVEMLEIAAIGTDVNDLVNWYNSLLVESYTDGRWHKTFQAGSPLEWYNPCDPACLQEIDSPCSCFGEGLQMLWVNLDEFMDILANKYPFPFICNDPVDALSNV